MLTDMQVRKAEPKEKGYKLFDAQGLYVFVTPKGHKSWRLKYKQGGKEKHLVLGRYPELTLKGAREAAGDLQRKRRQGVDPVLEAKRQKLVTKADEHTFEEMALRWFELERKHWRPVHADDVLKSMKRDLLPDLGAFPLGQIDRQLLLAVLQKVIDRGAIETAHRLRQRCEAIFDRALSLGICADNPAVSLGGAMQRKPPKKRWPAITSIRGIRELLRASDTAGASPITRAASRMMALTGQRPGMIQNMRWDQVKGVDWNVHLIDDAEATWVISAADMKGDEEKRSDTNFDHDVPLSPAAVELLRELRAMTGGGSYVFWSSRSSRKPISENAVGYLYQRLGYKGRHVPHGWRSSFSTIMNELYADEAARSMSWRAIIDMMLAHIPDKMSASEWSYNRAKFADRRRIVANRWAEILLQDAVPTERVIGGPRRSEPA